MRVNRVCCEYKTTGFRVFERHHYTFGVQLCSFLAVICVPLVPNLILFFCASSASAGSVNVSETEGQTNFDIFGLKNHIMLSESCEVRRYG